MATVLLPGTVLPIASAASTTGSSVIYDLQEDPTFTIADYPIDETNYSLQVFHVAESTEGDLLIYVYQPSTKKDFRATSISLSETTDHEVDYHLFNLTYQNSYRSLYKYKVNDFKVNKSATRNYLIAEIFRSFDSSIDDETALVDGHTNEIAFPVSKQWEISNTDDGIITNCYDIETITITNKLVGFVRRDNGWLGNYESEFTDCHLVAFSTDRDIDELIEAKVAFTSQSYFYRSTTNLTGTNVTEEYGEEIPHEVQVFDTDVYDIDNTKYYGEAYTLKRIQTTKEFLDNEIDRTSVYYNGIFVKFGQISDLHDEAKAAFEQMQFVLHFYESAYDHYTSGGGTGSSTQTTSTVVQNVTILQLKFKQDGVEYNLGVVDNKTTGSRDPLNVHEDFVEDGDLVEEIWARVVEFFKDLWEKAKTPLLIVIGIVVGLIVIFLIAKIVSNKKSKQVITVQTSTSSKPKKTKKPVKKTAKKKKSNKGGKR